MTTEATFKETIRQIRIKAASNGIELKRKYMPASEPEITEETTFDDWNWIMQSNEALPWG